MYATYPSTFKIQDLTGQADTPMLQSINWFMRSLQKAQFLSDSPPSPSHRSRTFKFQGVGAAISSDGKLIVSQDDNVAKIWQTDGRSPNHDTAVSSNPVSIVTFSGDGRLIVSVALDNTVKLWNATTGQDLHTFSQSQKVTSVILSSDSTRLAFGTNDHTINIWDTCTHRLISAFTTHGTPASLGFSPNGNQLVSVRYSQGVMDLDLWEVATGECLASREVINRAFHKVSFSVDGTSVFLEDKGSAMGWRIQHSTDDSYSNRSPLPMEFVTLHDTLQPVSPRLYHYLQGSEWILDEKKRRVLWVPFDLRSRRNDCHGKKIVFGSYSGNVQILDFSDVEY